MDSSRDDPPKKRQTKRDCTEVVQTPSPVQNEKKLKKDTQASKKAKATTSSIHSQAQAQDLETALNHSLSGDQQNELLPDGSCLSFRLGHAGDASTLASWYRHKTQKTSPDQAKNENLLSSDSSHKASSSLEIWLADALGNEDMPPSVFAILAHVQSGGDKKANTLAAVALLNLAWKHSARVLHVEWFQVDEDVDSCRFIERRMWLRLAALGLMTACEIHVMEAPTSSLVLEGK